MESRDSKWRNLKPLVNNPEHSGEIKDKVRRGAAEMARRIRNYLGNTAFDYIESAEDLRSDWLESLAEEFIMKYLTGRTDLHAGNIGLTQYGNFRYFDPAYSHWTSNINV